MLQPKYQTQWAGQYGVAHELTRRGYLVSFTIGNAPKTDLICTSPKGKDFSVQVKSLTSKSYFLYQESLLSAGPDLFFVFVLAPEIKDEKSILPVEYYILNRTQFRQIVEKENLRINKEEEKRGKPYAQFSPGIIYATIKDSGYRDAWNNLPE